MGIGFVLNGSEKTLPIGVRTPGPSTPIKSLYELRHPGSLVCLWINLQTIQIFGLFFSYSVLWVSDWKAPYLAGILVTLIISYVRYSTKSCPPFLSPACRYKEHAIRYNMKGCVTDWASCVAHSPAMETIPPPIFLAYSLSRWMKATEIAFIAYTMSTPTTHFVLN